MTQYGETSNGDSYSTTYHLRSWGALTALQNMNGSSFFAFCLWPFPDDIDFDDYDPSAAEEYLQCAGSAEAMTVELRVVDDRGHEHYVVGREPLSGECDVVIRYDEFSVRVHPSEVFTAEQAAPLFDQYLRTTTIPDGYHLRRLDL